MKGFVIHWTCWELFHNPELSFLSWVDIQISFKDFELDYTKHDI